MAIKAQEGDHVDSIADPQATIFGKWIHGTRVHDKLDFTSLHSE